MVGVLLIFSAQSRVALVGDVPTMSSVLQYLATFRFSNFFLNYKIEFIVFDIDKK